MAAGTFQGSLFSGDFVEDTIKSLPDWSELTDTAVSALRAELAATFARFPTAQTPNETQTEDDLIWAVLRHLGWTEHLRQQNLTTKGRQDVPDGILYLDAAAKARAVAHSDEWRRYEFGAAIVESKRWNRPLDRRSGHRDEVTAPSTQMLRYLRRVDDITNGNLRWGLLTNGAKWRLYFAGARSVAEQFFEVDLAAILGVAGFNDGLFALTSDEQDHWLRVFILVFRRQAFVPGTDRRTFHQRAIDEGRFYEERVAQNLSDLVFGFVYPQLAQGVARAAPDAELAEVRDAALILLYRLLFVLYAEDRDLLPVRDPRYDDYGLRERVRLDVGRRMDAGDTFSASATRYWSAIDDLCRAIDEGDADIGLPPYNGGLFSRSRTPLLSTIRLGDALLARVIDTLSFIKVDGERRYINYRDLSVQQLGSIYERLLEHEIVRDGAEISVRPNIFARKSSGSYYTPDDLVGLILDETLEPLVARTMTAFAEQAEKLDGDNTAPRRLARLDPAMRMLDLRICDPAMGSGHFLVSLVDKLADRIIEAMAEAEARVSWADYVSPLAERIEAIRNTILNNAEERGWAVNDDQLDDRHIIRRMVLKRCVFGVDKNVMAVELAKVALWLHTFTVGAPLSFLDHHLRAGDSLFGSWVRDAIAVPRKYGSGGGLLIHERIAEALASAAGMKQIEAMTDVEIAEAHKSAAIFEGVTVQTAPLVAFLSLLHALKWLNVRDRADRLALGAYFDGTLGDIFRIAQGREEPNTRFETGQRFARILREARELVAEQGFLHWQVAFPGVWDDWELEGLTGGFDAIVGNPPWDRIKLQQVEWFAARRPEIAHAQRASDRQAMVARLIEAGDPLADDFAKASQRAETASKVARDGGDYPLLSGGDINLYSLFVERAMTLVKPEGIVGLLTPSGIASDLTASAFFKSVATEGRLLALYDFENRRPRYSLAPFFPDVDSRFKFCAFVASPAPAVRPARCAFFLQAVAELADPDVCFSLTAEDFARVNPNTGTAPIFRSRRDADLTTAIYGRLPVLVDRRGAEPVSAWPVRYRTMFHMTNDSSLFRTRVELEEQEGAFHVGGNRYRSAVGDWVPLYVGRMIHIYDHRAASVRVNAANLHNPALSGEITADEKADPNFVPTPQFWVPASRVDLPPDTSWLIAFRDIARATDARTMICAAGPATGYGNTAPLILSSGDGPLGPELLANLAAVPLDYVVRQKAQSTHLNWYIVEQLPVVPPETYRAIRFGTKSASEIVREAVLELTYTAHDMAPFARDMGYVDAQGAVRPPFVWDEDRRLHLRAKLDALYFHLYGITNRDDVRYIYSTFPIVEREETAIWGRYRSRDLCLAYMNALAAGHPDAVVEG